jgi:hypothetical protein
MEPYLVLRLKAVGAVALLLLQIALGVVVISPQLTHQLVTIAAEYVTDTKADLVAVAIAIDQQLEAAIDKVVADIKGQ